MNLRTVKLAAYAFAALAAVVAVSAAAYRAGHNSARAELLPMLAEAADEKHALELTLADYREAAEKLRADHLEHIGRVAADWQTKFDNLTRTHHAKVAAVDAGYREQLDRLRDRAERPAPAPGQLPEAPRAGCEGANGRELARGDAAFLAGFAHRAARLDAALQACYAALDVVKLEAGSGQLGVDPPTTP